MTLTKKIIAAVFIFIGVILFIRFVLGGPEDSWVCDKGTWIKHGSPSYPKPTADCKK